MTDQSEFTAALLAPDLPVPQGLSGPDGQPVGKRFDVYRNNVVFSLVTAAEGTFPGLLKLIGQRRFRALAADFVRACPPSSKLMMHFGVGMPEFLETYSPLTSIGYLPDFARVELSMRRSYHAADSTPIESTTLSDIAPDELMRSSFTFAPAAILTRSKWPVFSIWQMNFGNNKVKVEMRAEDVLVTRPEFDPQLNLLPSGAGALVQSLNDGLTFGAALEAAEAETENFDLADTLSVLLAGGAITNIKTQDNL